MSIKENFEFEWKSSSGLNEVGPFFEGEITPSTLSELYPLLQSPFSEEAVQRTKKTETKKAYDTTGVGYQFLVNRMNEVLGPSFWNESYELLNEVEGEWGTTPRKNITIAVEATVEIGNWINGEFVSIKRVSGIGGHKGEDWSDTLKGARSNALKKALGFLGVGREAYEGTLDDDNKSDVAGASGPGDSTAGIGKSVGAKRSQSDLARSENKGNAASAAVNGSVKLNDQRSVNTRTTPQRQAGAGAKLFTGQIIINQDPVMKNSKASARGVVIDTDVEVEICGWENRGMAEEVMSYGSGEVIWVENANIRETEQFGVQISLNQPAERVA